MSGKIKISIILWKLRKHSKQNRELLHCYAVWCRGKYYRFRRSYCLYLHVSLHPEKRDAEILYGITIQKSWTWIPTANTSRKVEKFGHDTASSQLAAWTFHFGHYVRNIIHSVRSNTHLLPAQKVETHGVHLTFLYDYCNSTTETSDVKDCTVSAVGLDNWERVYFCQVKYFWIIMLNTDRKYYWSRCFGVFVCCVTNYVTISMKQSFLRS